jgi:hypothetical protein
VLVGEAAVVVGDEDDFEVDDGMGDEIEVDDRIEDVNVADGVEEELDVLLETILEITDNKELSGPDVDSALEVGFRAVLSAVLVVESVEAGLLELDDAFTPIISLTHAAASSVKMSK